MYPQLPLHLRASSLRLAYLGLVHTYQDLMYCLFCQLLRRGLGERELSRGSKFTSFDNGNRLIGLNSLLEGIIEK